MDDKVNCIAELESCLNDVNVWMTETRLKMNPKKTEVILFGDTHQLKKVTVKEIKVVNDTVLTSQTIRYLGAWLDSTLNFQVHVTKKSASAMANICRLMHIHRYLDQPTCEILVCSLV